MQIQIRTETVKDYPAVYDLNYNAFDKRNDESDLVNRIRASAEFIPELSLVAELEDGTIAGYLMLSQAEIRNGSDTCPVLALAPLAVRPDYQRQGIGGELIREGQRRAKKLGYGLILLIGHPEYYPRFGFVPAREHGLELTQYDVPDEVFMVCELRDGELRRIQGELIYPPAFSDS